MNTNPAPKKQVQDLACFGGARYFAQPKSASSLAQPDFDRFLHYSEKFFKQQYYTNNGVLVQLLEKRLAEFHDTEYCVAFCSGFWGVALAMSALALQGKSEIIMPSLTYRRMADIAAWVRLKPRFCEVDPNTLAPNRKTVADCINPETALIMAVHPIVNCCDIDGIVSLGRKHGIPVLFDSVESVYEWVNDGKVGSFGDAECFSMHASKLLNGFEGGYVTTKNAELAHRLAVLRTYGFSGQDNCVVAGGLNAKLNEIHAAMALANLDELEDLVADNRRRYETYLAGLKEVHGIRLLEFDTAHKTSYKNIVVEVLDDWPLTRDATVSLLNAENILARAYYSPALHQKKMQYPFVPATLETTDYLARRFMLLPCGDFVTCEDVDKVIQLLGFIHVHGAEIAQHLQAREATAS